jgi:hypothetical protein
MAAFCDMGYNVTGHVTGNISLQDCKPSCQEANFTPNGKKMAENGSFCHRER